MATPNLDDQIERAAAIAGVIIVDGWRPIETVPTPDPDKPETLWIIGYTSWGQHVGKFHEWVGPCEWVGSHFEFTNTDFDAFPVPTHWMPWPAGPSQS